MWSCGGYCTRHGETSVQFFNCFVAHSLVWLVWQPTQGFGILYVVDMAGVMNLNVWLRTLMFAIVGAIFGMWHSTQSLPRLAAGCFVCASIVVPRGPVGEFGPWHVRQSCCAGLMRSALYAVPCTSWQLAHVTPLVYIALCTKSFPCIRFLCAVPSA